MAEFYGEKPKRFTKEWWPYFWLYYKWHVLGIILISSIVGLTIKDCVTKEKYDLEIVYLGRMRYSSEALDKVRNALLDEISDADKNGEKNIVLLQLNVGDDKSAYDMAYAYRSKRDLEMSTNKYAYMYIYDKAEAENILEQNGIDSLYKPLGEWFLGDASVENVLNGTDGKPYAICLSDSEILKEVGMEGEELYVMIKNDEYSKKTNDTAEKNAIAAANKLVK